MASKILMEAGFPMTEQTLAVYACRKIGPPVEYFGRIPLYPVDQLLQWAENRIRKPADHTA